MVGTVREHLCLQGNSRIGTVMLSAFPVGHVDVFTRVNLQAGVIRQDGNRDPVFRVGQLGHELGFYRISERVAIIQPVFLQGEEKRFVEIESVFLSVERIVPVGIKSEVVSR